MTQETTSIQARGGPFVKAAFLCDRILQENDGVASYIRVVDQITAQSQAFEVGERPPGVPPPTVPDKMPASTIVNTNLVVMFSAGGALGRHVLELRMRAPNGLYSALGTPQDIHFDGRRQSSIAMHAALNLLVTDEGPYVIEVSLDGIVRTEVAFDIRYERGTVTKIG